MLIGDEQMEGWASSMGFSGSGTEADPYIVQDITIDANATTDCLYLEGIDRHVVIRDCSFTDASGTGTGEHLGSGLCLVSCANVSVENVKSTFCRFGVRISYSSHCSVNGSRMVLNWGEGAFVQGSDNISVTASNLSDNFNSGITVRSCRDVRIEDDLVSYNDFGVYALDCVNCTFKRNRCTANDDHGIRLEACMQSEVSGNEMRANDDGVHLAKGSDGNEVRDNAISDCREYAIYMEDSSRNDFSGNLMANCSFMIDRDTLSGQDIDRTNLANGRPVIYIDGSDGQGMVLREGGQLILSGSSNYSFEDMDLSHGSAGVLMQYCSSIDLRNITMAGETYYGVRAGYCTNCTVSNSTVYGSMSAFDLLNSQFDIEDSIIKGSVYGVDSRYARTVGIYRCDIIDVDVPITVAGSTTSVRDCHIEGGYTGISISNSPSFDMEGCRVSDVRYGIHLKSCDSISISGSILERIEYDGIVVRDQSKMSLCIRDSSIRDASGSGVTMVRAYCSSIDDARIHNNTISFCARAIYLEDSEMIAISGNVIKDCGPGIRIDDGVGQVSIDSNRFTNCSVDYRGTYSHGSMINVTFRNTVNDWPLIFVIAKRDAVIEFSGRAGLVKAVMCHDLRIRNISVHGSPIGLEIEGSSSILMENISAAGCGIGISLRMSNADLAGSSACGCENGVLINGSECSVLGSNISGNIIGMRIEGCPDSKMIRIADNVFIDNSIYAVMADFVSRGIVVESNLFAFNRGSGRSLDERFVQACDDGYATWAGNYWLDLVGRADQNMSSYRLDGRGNADDYPASRVPVKILPPPDASKMRATKVGNTTTVEWEPVDGLSMVPVSGYNLYEANCDSTTLLDKVGSARTNWSKDIGHVDRIIISTMSYLGESEGSIGLDVDQDEEAPEIMCDIGNVAYYATQDVGFEFSVLDRSALEEVWVRVDGERISQWSGNEGPSPGNVLQWIAGAGTSDGELNYFSLSLSGQTEGPHALEIRCHDRFRNEAIWRCTFVIDLTMPSVDIMSPLEGVSYIGPDLNITWICSDIGSGIASATLGINRVSQMGIEPGAGTYDASIDLGELVLGENEMAVVAVDRAGNEARRVVGFRMTLAPSDIVSYYPVGPGTPVDRWIGARFSDPILPGTLEVALVDEDMRRIVPLDLTIDSDLKGFVGSHAALKHSTDYSVQMKVEDGSGAVIVKNWSFTTEPTGSDQDKWRVNGTIRDMDGRPISGVDIIVGGGIAAATDVNGEFELWLGQGEHDLTFMRSGFKDLTIRVVLGPEGAGEMGDIYLEKDDKGTGHGPFVLLATVCVIFAVLMIAYLVARRRTGRLVLEE